MLSEAVRAAVQRVLVASLAFNPVFDAVENEAAVCDPVGVAAGDGAEMRRMGEIVLDRVQAKDHALAPAPMRDDEITHDRAPGQDFGFRARLGPDLDLEHRDALKGPELALCHVALLIAPA